MFTNIVAKWPGSSHDSFVFSSSKIGQHFEESPTTFEEMGDSGYPCKPYLTTPFLNPVTGKQEAYNKAHVHTRVEIEQSFGWWKWRFHVLHSEGRMNLKKLVKSLVCVLYFTTLPFCSKNLKLIIN